MEKTDRIRQMILRVIDAINAEAPKDQQISTDPSAILLGEGGSLDSMGFVDLAMQLQEAVLDEYDVAVTVADEKMLENAEGPFKTIESLVEHVAGLLENE